jgi:hypothetical protein
MRIIVPALFAMVACAPGTITVDENPGDDTGAANTATDDTGSSTADTDDTSASDTDTDTDTDTEDTDPKPSLDDWGGSWIGTVILDEFGDDYFDGCEGDITLNFSDEGQVGGIGFCVYGDSGFDLTFAGSFTAKGEVIGRMIVGFTTAGDTPVEVIGGAANIDLIQAGIEGDYEYESWWTDYSYDITGEMTLSRE